MHSVRQWAGAKDHDTVATINAKTSHGKVPKMSCVVSLAR